jgi:hypothetical protein
MSSSVIAASDGPETLLSSSIPNLQLNRLPILLNRPNFEVNTNGAYVAVNVSIISESEKKTRFSNRGVTDQQKLEQIIVLVAHDLAEDCVSEI